RQEVDDPAYLVEGEEVAYHVQGQTPPDVSGTVHNGAHRCPHVAGLVHREELKEAAQRAKGPLGTCGADQHPAFGDGEGVMFVRTGFGAPVDLSDGGDRGEGVQTGALGLDLGTEDLAGDLVEGCRVGDEACGVAEVVEHRRIGLGQVEYDLGFGDHLDLFQVGQSLGLSTTSVTEAFQVGLDRLAVHGGCRRRR